jgi:DNA-binding transcriptional MerR regulator
MAEFSRISGVPTATIKFYLREGLLEPGHRTAPNQATYDESHLRRLRLVRALREVGGLRIETIRRVLESVDGAEHPWNVVGRVCDAIGETHRRERQAGPEARRAARDVDAFLAANGLPKRAESSSRAQLIDALASIRGALGTDFPAEMLGWYSDAVRDLAQNEVAASGEIGFRAHFGTGGPDLEPGARDEMAAMLEGIVYGTVLFEPVLLAFRRLWHERFAEDRVAEPDDRVRGLSRSARR